MTTIAEGTRVTLGVRRGDQQVAAALTTIAPQEGTTGSLLGLSLKISVDSKVDATFGLSDVGGPSAGMMFALGVVDEITPGGADRWQGHLRDRDDRHQRPGRPYRRYPAEDGRCPQGGLHVLPGPGEQL